MLDLTNLKTIKQQLAVDNLRPSKALGQNFLLSRKIIDRIIKAADLSRQDTVLEIGPGLGVLTLELAKHVKQVIAVEQDPKLVELLQKNILLRQGSGGHVKTEKLKNVKVINEDILKVTSNQLPRPRQAKRGGRVTSYKVVANLPYQITSPVLWKFLHEEKNKPELMVLMMQKEVAERIIALPGNKSLLSVLAQFYAEPKIVANVKSTLFYPQPKVNSTVVKLKVKNEKRKINEDLLFKLVKAGFKAKRKTLRNNLKASGFSQSDILNALSNIDLSEKVRAQELSINNWLNLYKVLYNNNKRI